MTDSDNTTLQGLEATDADRTALMAALEQAFDYRGDVTITRRGGETVAGYIFDRRTGQTLDDSFVRLIPSDSDDKIEIVYADIAKLEFTGKDTAHGKTWENWIKRYVAKKRAGEKAEIASEALD